MRVLLVISRIGYFVEDVCGSLPVFLRRGLHQLLLQVVLRDFGLPESISAYRMLAVSVSLSNIIFVYPIFKMITISIPTI